jgi:hypothetical protein
MTDLTRERVLELLIYDPNSGDFIRRVSRVNARAGTVAESLDVNGYLTIRIEPRVLRTPAAWLVMHGRWPADRIDHDNGACVASAMCRLSSIKPGMDELHKVTELSNRQRMSTYARRRNNMKAFFTALFGPLIATALCVQSANAAPRRDQAREKAIHDQAREKAIRECNRAAVQYPNATYGATFEIDVYRACMAQRGQQE